MKIQGPGGSGKPPGVGDAGKAEGAGKVEGEAFVDKLAEKQGAAGAPGVGGSGSGDAIAALARDLQSGAVTPRQALDRLLDMTSNGVLAGVPEAARNVLRARLEKLIGEDPFLSAKAKRLGMPVDES
jgi:hypothetical protein